MNWLSSRFQVIGQIVQSFSSSGRAWMLPMIGVLIMLGMVLAGLSAVQVVAPFIYAVL